MAYFQYKFPNPQYLGSKYTHLDWIKQFIPKDTKIAIDAFSGSQSVTYLFKQMGFKTISNDFLNFNNKIGLALIENKNTILDKNDLDFLFSESTIKKDFELMENTFTDLFFERNECVFLDNLRANISLLDNNIKQALTLSIINRSMTRKVTMGHFGHTKALEYANDIQRVKRNKSLITPLKTIFEDLVIEYNNAVFDNNQDNKSYCKNVFDLLENIEGDLIYFDPPYCDSHADYQGFYHLLETYTQYWRDAKFVNSIKRYENKYESFFDKKRDVINSFEKLFEKSSHIENWLISYNNRSYPHIDELVKMISKHRNVQVEMKTYLKNNGGKGSVKGSSEVLIICTK